MFLPFISSLFSLPWLPKCAQVTGRYDPKTLESTCIETAFTNVHVYTFFGAHSHMCSDQLALTMVAQVGPLMIFMGVSSSFQTSSVGLSTSIVRS